MPTKGLELEDYEHYKREISPTDYEVLHDSGLRVMYDLLNTVRKFMDIWYPHVTTIAGWKLPGE